MREYLPTGWTVKKTSEFCLRVADGTHDTPKPVAEGRPLITSKNLDAGRVNYDGAYMITEADYQQINKRSKVDCWDVLFSMIGTVGEIALIRTEPDFAIKNIGLFKSKTREDGIWLYYYLTSSIGQAALDTFLSGTSQQFVALGDLRKVPVIIPIDKSKTKIVAILSAYDELIENNKRRITLLEKMAEEIYREWFVRLRFPGHQKVKITKGLPEGWIEQSIGDLCKVARGSSPRPITDQRFFSNGTIPWIKIADATASKMFIYETKEYVNEFGASFSRKLSKGDLIIATSGTLGFCIFLGVEGCIHDGWMYLSNYKDGLKPIFLYYLINQYREYLNSLSYGAAIQNINTDIIRRLPIKKPPGGILEKFYAIIEPMHGEIFKLSEVNRNLIAIRDMLLPRLISGKLSVENLDIQFPPSIVEEVKAVP